MPTPEQFNAAWEREKQGILDALERAKEANEAALASLGRGKTRIKKRTKMLTVCFVGLPQAGKSSMLNALAGKHLLRTGPCRTTT